MSLTENTIARSREQETTSVTGTPVSIVAVALLSGVLAPAPLISFEKHESYKIIVVPSVKSQIAKIITWTDTESYFQPRTLLGKRLLAIRNRAISKGLPLLDADEIMLELSRRRGELINA
ncbi:MAG: hypothetical protein KGZ49_08470 [Syntrophaceae bacterium]|nr:hypothetical protein [Syntrophaceae bacterium]